MPHLVEETADGQYVDIPGTQHIIGAWYQLGFWRTNAALNHARDQEGGPNYSEVSDESGLPCNDPTFCTVGHNIFSR